MIKEDKNIDFDHTITINQNTFRPIRKSGWKIGLYSLLGFVVGVLLLLMAAVQILTHTSVGKRWIIGQVDSLIEGGLLYDRMDISLLTTFPELTLELEQVVVTSSCTQMEDTLLSFDRLYVAVNIASLISRGEIDISKIQLVRPTLDGWIDQQGTPAWALYAAGSSSDTTAVKLPNIRVDSLIIQEGSLRFFDFKARREAILGPFTIMLQGGLGDDLATLNGSIGISSLNYSDSSGFKISNIPLFVELDVESSKAFHNFKWRTLGVQLDQLVFSSQGELEALNDYKSWRADATVSLSSGSLSNLLSYIPAPYDKMVNTYELDGRFDSQGSVRGVYDGVGYPVVHYQLEAQDLKMAVKGYDQQLDQGSLKGIIHLDINNPTASYCSVDQLHISAGGSKLEAQAQVDNLLKNQQIDFDLKANVNLSQVPPFTAQMRGYTMAGQVQADLGGQFNMANLLAQRWTQLDLKGGVVLQNINLSKPSDTLSTYISKARLTLGANQVSKRDAKRKILFGGRLQIDSLYLAHAKHLQVGLRELMFSSHATDLGANKVPSSHIAIRWSALNSALRDSISVTSQSGRAVVALMADRVKRHIPKGIISIELSKFRLRQPGSRISTDSTGFKIQVTPRERRSRKQMQVRDTLTRIMDLDSLYRLVMRTVNHPNPSEEFAKRFHIKGDSYSRSFRMRTPYLPLRTSIKNFSFKFTEDTLHLEKLQVKVGASDVTLRGDVANFRRALLYNRGELKAELEMSSNRLDINELLRAVNKGNQYRLQQQQFSSVELDKQEVVEGVSEEDEMGLFVIPERWNLLFKTDAKHVSFGKMDMREFKGDAYLKSGALRINDLTVYTGLGNLQMDVLYECKNSSQAKVGASLSLDRVRLDSLVEQLPMLDTIVPMLRSFEGVVDCQISALADVDSLFNLKLPTVNAAAWLKGNSLVLLDGQDFAEIAKMLMFKNKKRNLIDSISVEMVVRNNQMEILPFVFEMDRYKAAVGGTHGFDMSFNYHISVLRSPIPFKLGVNVYGTLEKPKFRLVAPKYSDPKTAVRMGTLLDGRVNIRQELQRALDKTISEIIE